jgi:diaminohydroxyphosphoribosylaminopyrimidine deaminase/5-amino-6-(5-phosphoribosylamino)uracil reductase
MQESSDNKLMRRCIDLAVRSEGHTWPNPMVGAVIVHNGTIIGEGYHLKAGEPHAEVNAVNSVKEKALIPESVMYVSLEPCSHHGKTPPCADMIISSGIREVVIGTTDTSRKVSGNGIRRLREAGVKVTAGVMEKECRQINRRFFTFHEKERPYITLKWAESADRFIDIIRPEGSDREPYWISGKAERVLVHRWRATEEAILVGAGTVRSDNPRLNVRYWSGKNPVRLILSRSGKIGDYPFLSETFGRIITFTMSDDFDPSGSERVILSEGSSAIVQILEWLYNNEIQSLFVEGGATVLRHFIDEDLWDEARIFTGRSDFREGVAAPVIKGRVLQTDEFRLSTLKLIVNESNSFY